MLLSIIIPVFNAQKYLEQCLKSIMFQKELDCELLLIDDGSTDSSGAICDAYANNYSFIKVFHTKNGGPSKARNFGITQAKGKYIQFVDSDDEVAPNCFSEFKIVADQYAPDIIIGRSTIVNDEKKIIRSLSMDQKEDMEGLFMRMSIPQKEIALHYLWNKWYRRELIDGNNLLFDENVRLGEDFLFNCCFFTYAKTIKVSNENMYYYFVRNNGSLTHKFRKNEIGRRRIMDRKYRELLISKGAFDKKKFALQIGMITFESILSIVPKNDIISDKERIRIIKEFVESEYGKYLRVFGSAKETSLWKRIVISFLSKERYHSSLALIRMKMLIRS